MRILRVLALFVILLAAAGVTALLSGSWSLGLVAAFVVLMVAVPVVYPAWERGEFDESAGEVNGVTAGGGVVHRTATMHSSGPDGGGIGGF